jgi:hypothetical protein
VLVGCFWLLMHRVIPEEHGNSHLLEDKMKSKQHIQSLIEETHKLLREVVASNVSISKNTLQDLHMLTADTNLVNKDLKELNKQLTRLEDGYTVCMKEKYDLGAALQVCKNNEKRGVTVHSPPCPASSNAAVAPVVPQITAPAASSSVTTPDSTAEKWLVIGIPTVSRTNNEEYLLQSLETLAQQLPTDPSDLMFDRIVVNIVNLQVNAHPGVEHVVYTKAKERFSHAAGHPKARYFTFSEVTKETRNIVTVMRRNMNKAKYYLFLEDDMEFCAHGLLAIQYLLDKASRYHPNWLAIRASYGMNGIFMHDKDLSVFADYLVKHQSRRPPDHLVVEWYAGETPESAKHKSGRANIGFKFNLFNHIGVVSTLRSQRSTSYPRCYDVLQEPTVFQVEAYNPRQCPKDDVWPCNVPNPDKFKIDWAHQ